MSCKGASAAHTLGITINRSHSGLEQLGKSLFCCLFKSSRKDTVKCQCKWEAGGVSLSILPCWAMGKLQDNNEGGPLPPTYFFL